MTNIDAKVDPACDAVHQVVAPFLDRLDELEDNAEQYGPESGRGGRAYSPVRLRLEVEQLRTELGAAEQRVYRLLQETARFVAFFDQES
jgi:putative NIF3 family GTP cyclohydrolase 1 type 2